MKGDNGTTNGMKGDNGTTNGMKGDNGTTNGMKGDNGTTNGMKGDNGTTNGMKGDNGTTNGMKGDNGTTNGMKGDNGTTNGNIRAPIMIYNDMIYNGMIYNGVIYNGMIYNKMIYNDTIYNDMIYNDMIYNDMIYNDMIYNDMIYNDMIYNDMIYNDMIYNAMIYNDFLAVFQGTYHADNFCIISNDCEEGEHRFWQRDPIKKTINTTLSDPRSHRYIKVLQSSVLVEYFEQSLCSLKPGAPVIVNTASYEAGSATLTWTPPVDANGIILNYRITLKSEEGSTGTVVDGTVLTTVFEDLHQCESYSFSVAARTTVGYGPESEDSSVSISGNITLKEAICSVEESNAKMCWSANYPQCQVSYYNVTWNGTVKWSDQSVTGSGVYLWAGATENCYVVNDSVPFTDYTLCVEVEDLTSETFCCSSDTPESGKLLLNSRLLNLEVIQTSITVSWSDPVDKNGIINGYLVTWTSNNGDTGNQSVGLSTSSYEIPDLVACETYSVTVQASTSAGWGDEAPPENATIPNYLPESGLNCVNGETRQVEVSWSLVSPECSVSEFFLAWNTSVLWSSSSSSNSTLLDGDVYSTVLADLQPYTEVSACLSIPDDGRGGVCCTCITGEEVPGPPVLEKLEVIQASITVSWSDPVDKNGVINGYLVTWTSNSGDTGNQSVGSDSKTYVIPDLVACETYSVTVQASTSAGWGDGAPLENATIPNYIPESGMTCTNETRRVEISWRLASLECPGTTFFLGWETKVLWSTSTSSNGTLLGGDVTSAVISDLQPYTEVTACLSIPDDPRGKVCCTCITDEEVPGPPVLEELEVIQASITVSWSEPVDKNGVINGYLVTWTSNSGDTGNQSVGSDSKTYVIPDLVACETYSVTVQANTSAGWGEGAPPENITIANYIPESDLQCTNETRQVEVSWSLASEECPVSGLLLAWNTSVLWSSTTSSYSTPLDGSVTSATLSDLQPDTEVYACLSIPDDVHSKMCCNCVTPEEAPGPPVLENLVIDLTSITVSWSEPVDKNGIIDGYLVTWTSNNGVTGNQLVGSESRTYVIQDLAPCYTYSVTVQAHTGAGWGIQSSPQNAAVLNYLPESSLHCVNTSARQVDVSWSLASPDCSVSQFLVAWEQTVLWNSNKSSFSSSVIAGDAEGVVLTELYPYTEVYTVVMIMDEQGVSVSCTTTTDQDVPGPPELENLEVKETNITVSWSEPVDKNGIIDGYLVTWTSNSNDTESQAVGQSTNSYEIPDLQLCETYSVTVQANTSAGWGDGAPPEIATIPNYIPESDLQCTNETRQVEVSWSLASEECPVSGLLLAWNTSVLWSSTTSSNTTSLDGEETTVVLSDLLPYTMVFACLSINNTNAETLCCSTITPQEPPGPPVITKITALEGSATVTWTPPEEANGVIVEYTITWKGQDGIVNTITTDGSLLTTVVNDLQKCEAYNFTVAAKTEAGVGDPSDESSAFVYANSTSSNAKCQTVQSKVKLCWDTDLPKCPASYRLTWNGTVKWSDQPDVGSDTFTLAANSERCYVLNDSVPYTDYTLCVNVENLTSEPSCCSQDTPQSVPGAPVIVDFTTKHTNVSLEWSEPVDKNGVLDGYKVTWSTEHLDEYGFIEVNSTVFTYEIQDLLPCNTYGVSVQAHTAAGYGAESPSESAPIENFILESSLHCTSNQNRQVPLSWSLESSECSVPKFFLAWNTSVLWSNTTSFNTTTLGTEATSFTLSDLEPYTKVDACLSTQNDQKSSICCTATTAQEAPSPPQALTTGRSTKTSITLSWSPPQSLNGELKSWVLNWSHGDAFDTRELDDPSSLQHTIDNLQPKTTYIINLQAANDAGVSLPTEVEASTVGSVASAHVGAIVGGSVGGLVLLLVIAGGVYFSSKTRMRPRKSASARSTKSSDIAMNPQDDDEVQDLYKNQQKSYKQQRYWLKN
nr:phosphatidylinositol phosphatase PTPRQ-like [Procambarus clarkii]